MNEITLYRILFLVLTGIIVIVTICKFKEIKKYRKEGKRELAKIENKIAIMLSIGTVMGIYCSIKIILKWLSEI